MLVTIYASQGVADVAIRQKLAHYQDKSAKGIVLICIKISHVGGICTAQVVRTTLPWIVEVNKQDFVTNTKTAVMMDTRSVAQQHIVTTSTKFFMSYVTY